MSVPKFKRKLSNLFIYDETQKLRLEIISYLNNFLKQDRLYKENSVNIEDSFHKNLVNTTSKKILNLLSEVMSCISIADSIFPMNYAELYQRIIYQNKATGLTKAVMQELILLSDLFPDKLNGLLMLADKLNTLSSGIKNWKKSSNKIVKRLNKLKKDGKLESVNIPIEIFDI